MKRIIVSFLVLLMLGNSAMGQSGATKAIGLRISDLVNLELGADYHRPIGKRNELTFYLGAKYYLAQEYDLLPNNKVENYYVARVNGGIINNNINQKPVVLKNPLTDKSAYEYYAGTESLNKYGTILPAVTIPLQIGIRQYLKPDNKKGVLFMTSGINLYTHIGQRISTVTTYLQAVNHVAADQLGVIGKFKEEIETQSGVAFTTTMSAGLGWQYTYKEKYFLEVNPIVEFNLQFASSSIDYHGFKQVQPRVLVTVGKFFNYK